ncbi:MAG: glycosyltransferase [Candidatus Anammoxibacter sp.]
MISVITITYNNYEDLKKTIDSIEGIPDIESIVINGGNCERTKLFLSQIKAQSISEQDRGISDAFNKGLQRVKGDAVLFLNSGDVLKEKGYLAKAKDELDRNPEISFVHGNIIFGDSLCGAMLMKPALCSLGRGMPYYHQTMVVRKSVFEKIGAFRLDYKFTMDFEFVCRMHRAGFKGYYWNESPVVIMDGSGVAVKREYESIMEGLRGLRENKLLNAENCAGFLTRYSFYIARALMIKLGLSGHLAKLKKIKHKKRALK